ncbi:unnamed protein product [Prorocentrum cordatum]|uniref:Uncharacterized protein n=1 Tax=Prorocentrum cordatum TaxID=2364126 RepID=A0ABN9TL42_9DINO|nr:unnamed protein product [Polarella glacialis]
MDMDDATVTVWDGSEKSLETYAQNVELLALGTNEEQRHLIGPKMMRALLAQPAQKKLAMRLNRSDATDKHGQPICPEPPACYKGAENLIETFKRSLGTQVIADVGERTEKYFYGGPGRTEVTKKHGQTMSQWIETEEDLYHELFKACKTIAPDLRDTLPDQDAADEVFEPYSVGAIEDEVTAEEAQDEEDALALEECVAMSGSQAAASRTWAEAGKIRRARDPADLECPPVCPEKVQDARGPHGTVGCPYQHKTDQQRNSTGVEIEEADESTQLAGCASQWGGPDGQEQICQALGSDEIQYDEQVRVNFAYPNNTKGKSLGAAGADVTHDGYLVYSDGHRERLMADGYPEIVRFAE